MFKSDQIQLHDWWHIGVGYHPTNTGKIIINIPGAGGSIEGYLNKYVNLGNYIQEKDIASFVRIPNDRPQEYELTVRTIINYCLDNSKSICGSNTPEIWLVGLSAGAGAIILTGWEYPEVTKILAINPFLEVKGGRDKIHKNLPMYEGELYLVKGEEDEVIASDTIDFLSKYASSVKELQTYVIPNCDHQLRGENNARILSQLPEYFFLGKYKTEEFPNGKKWINLLDEDNRTEIV